MVPVAVRGRLLDATTGTALGGATITLRLVEAPTLAGSRAGTTESEPQFRSASDRDGRFELAASVRSAVEILVTAPERVGWAWRGSLDSSRRALDLGELRVRPGRVLRGRVVDRASEGNPASVAGWLLAANFPTASSGEATEIRSSVRLRPDGTFELVAPVPFGDVQWRLGAGASRATVPSTTRVSPESGEVELEVAKADSIRGRVVGHDGSPLANIAIGDPFLANTVRTGADGSFVVPRSTRDTAAATTLRIQHAESWRAHAPLRGVPWGTSDLVVRLTPLPPFDLRVVDERGEPVAEFGIVVQREGLSPFAQDQVQKRGRHPDGVLRLACVQPGATWLRVLPVDAGLATSARLAVPDGGSSLTVVLPRRLAMPVRVVDGERPIEGLEIELLRAQNGADLALGDDVVDTRAGHRVAMTARALERIVLATTDADGRAELLRDPSLDGCVLRLRRARHADAVVRELAPPADGSPMLVVLPHHGSVHGTVRSPVVPFAELRIAVLGTRHRAGQSLLVDADGRFLCDDLPYGEHTLLLQRRVLVGPRVFGWLLPMRVAKVVVDAERISTTLDLSDLPFAQCRGVVRSPVPLPDDYAIDLWRERDDGTIDRAATSNLGGDGAFALDQLLPGTYRASFRRGAFDPRAMAGLHADRIVVGAGESVVLDLAHRPQRFVLQLVRPDGAPVVGERVQLRCGGVLWPPERYQLPLVDGELVLDPAPTLPIEVRGGEPEAPWSTPFVMPPDVAEATTTVVVPMPHSR